MRVFLPGMLSTVFLLAEYALMLASDAGASLMACILLRNRDRSLLSTKILLQDFL